MKMSKASLSPTDATSALELARQARQSIDALSSTKEERALAKAQRMAARGETEPKKTAKQLAKEAQEAKKALKERQQELANMATRLASWGLEEGLRQVEVEGADLSMTNGSATPACAAIMAGHAELALWVMSRPSHQWSARRYPHHRCEMSAAVQRDDPELLARIDALDPQLLALPSPNRVEGETRADFLFAEAMGESPRCAAWLARKNPETAQRWAEKVSGKEGRYFTALAPLLARAQGLMEEADALLTWCLPLIKGSTQGLAHQFLQGVAKNDDVEGLAWLFESHPAWAAELAQNGVSLFDFRYGWLKPDWKQEDKAPPCKKSIKRIDRAKGYNHDPIQNPRLTMPLAVWLAREEAQDCLDFALGMPAFKDQLGRSQKEPETYLWEAAYQITDPATVGKLARAGFDFDQENEEGWNYLSMVVYSHAANGKWLEMMGMKHSSQGDARGADGKTAFELARMGREPHKQLDKWRLVFERSAIRSGAGKSKAPANKAAKGRGRL
jgi:hypothetical protein